MHQCNTGLPAALKLMEKQQSYGSTISWLSAVIVWSEWFQSSHLTVNKNAIVFNFQFFKSSNFFTILIEFLQTGVTIIHPHIYYDSIKAWHKLYVLEMTHHF